MPEVEHLIFKDGDEEFEIYIASKGAVDIPGKEPGYRGGTLVDMERVQKAIQGYTRYALSAFRNFPTVEVEKITLTFNLKVGGKTGIPMLTEGSAESNFEIQVECKFPVLSNSQCPDS